MHEMTRKLITTIIALVEISVCNSTSHAEQKDVLVVFLEQENGQRSLHHQPSSDCLYFLSEFRKAGRTGEQMTLTFEAPPIATGKVLEVYCVRPNGSIQTNCDGTITRHSLRGYTAIANGGLGECIFPTDSVQGKKILKVCPMGSRCAVDALRGADDNRINAVLSASRVD